MQTEFFRWAAEMHDRAARNLLFVSERYDFAALGIPSTYPILPSGPRLELNNAFPSIDLVVTVADEQAVDPGDSLSAGATLSPEPLQ
ncbi:hypothetical protein [Nitrobacter hamburgensis]|nr:hypothetical protein [Nitrobacter hamburgensis]